MGKIQRSFRRDFKDIKEVLQGAYQRLNATFLFYAGMSHAYPALTYDDFQFFAQEAGILQSDYINDAAMLKCFNETIVSTNTLKKSGDRNLNRYEFLEILVRIA